MIHLDFFSPFLFALLYGWHRVLGLIKDFKPFWLLEY